MKIEELDYGNCAIVRLCGKEAYINGMGLWTRTGYKAGMADELAQHSEVHSSAMKVKPEIVCQNNMFLPRESSLACDTGFNLPSKYCGEFSNESIELRAVGRAHSSCSKRAGSSWPCLARSEESGGLICSEGANLRSVNNRRCPCPFHLFIALVKEIKRSQNYLL